MPAINHRLRLPDELLLLIFSHLERSDLVPLARCSHHFRQLVLPLIWDDVTARLSWAAARRLCMVARRPHIAPLVHRFDVGDQVQRDPKWSENIVVLPTFAGTLSQLGNLRRLSFAIGHRLDCGSLDGCYFPHLEALSMPFTKGNVSFVKRHPGITTLFSPRPYSLEIYEAMGVGKPLRAFSGDLNLMIAVLDMQPSPLLRVRHLDSGCYIRAIQPYQNFVHWCDVVGGASLRIGCLCIYVYQFHSLPGKNHVSRRVANVDALRLTFKLTLVVPDRICDFLSVFDGLRTLEFDCPAEAMLGDEGGNRLRSDFKNVLRTFTDACSTLETVLSPSGTKWERHHSEWVESGAGTLLPFDPFDHWDPFFQY